MFIWVTENNTYLRSVADLNHHVGVTYNGGVTQLFFEVF